jgi:hypothetical protein
LFLVNVGLSDEEFNELLFYVNEGKGKKLKIISQSEIEFYEKELASWKQTHSLKREFSINLNLLKKNNTNDNEIVRFDFEDEDDSDEKETSADVDESIRFHSESKSDNSYCPICQFKFRKKEVLFLFFFC